jgi:hypothetical protein
MDVNPQVEDLTGSDFGDGENSSEDPLSRCWTTTGSLSQGAAWGRGK